MSAERDALLDAAVERASWPTATARRGGRSTNFPWVPVLQYPTGGKRSDGRTQQILGVAFATREQAVERAERTIAAQRATLRAHLEVRRCRALRVYHGLPADLDDLPD